MSVIIPLPICDFDPSEAGIFWKVLTESNHCVTFATPDGKVAKTDHTMLTGKGLGPFGKLLMADRNAQLAYQEMVQSDEFQNPLSYEQVDLDQYQMLFFPGGHKKEGMQPYLENELLQSWCAHFLKPEKFLAAVCHGVLIPARAKDPNTGQSLIRHRKLTGLIRSGERMAYHLTRYWVGNYYLTYPHTTVEEEVCDLLADRAQFKKGPPLLFRDHPKNKSRGFVVEDGNLITGRWPGDMHQLAHVCAHKLS